MEYQHYKDAAFELGSLDILGRDVFQRPENFELVGQRRFELAQRFSDETLQRLVDLSPDCPNQAKARILFAFTFFEAE